MPKGRLTDREQATDLLTPSQVADLLGVDPKTVTRWAQAGKLPTAALTVGGHRRYRRSDLDQYLPTAEEIHDGPDA